MASFLVHLRPQPSRWIHTVLYPFGAAFNSTCLSEAGAAALQSLADHGSPSRPDASEASTLFSSLLIFPRLGGVGDAAPQLLLQLRHYVWVPYKLCHDKLYNNNGGRVRCSENYVLNNWSRNY